MVGGDRHSLIRFGVESGFRIPPLCSRQMMMNLTEARIASKKIALWI